MRRYPAQDLEPAPRDPKKLRRTAFILVGVMALGAIGILIAYNQDAARRAEDDRPALVARLDIRKDLKVWRQDESEAGLLDLAGDVFVIAPVCFREPEGWATTRGILLELKERYAGREDFHLVCVTVDPENEPPKELANYAADLGAELPFWWLVATRDESTHKFLKNELKASQLPHEADGKWVYDGSLVVVDRDRHLRQPTIRVRKPSGKELNYRTRVPFDFEEAAKWDAEGRAEGLDKSNVETLRELLFKTIDELLATPAKKEQS